MFDIVKPKYENYSHSQENANYEDRKIKKIKLNY